MAWMVAVFASMLLVIPAVPASAAGCVPTANVPVYASLAQRATASAHLSCGGYYELKLVSSFGTVLAQKSGLNYGAMTVYTTGTYCPTGTIVHTFVYAKATVQGNTYISRVSSDSIVCG